MQTIEAIISFLFFVAIVSHLLLSLQEPKINDSLYRLQLAEDSWRVLYLRGDFENFSEAKRDIIERDMGNLGDETALCFFLNGTQYTNCRGGNTDHEITVSISKTIIYDGKPQRITFSMGR